MAQLKNRERLQHLYEAGITSPTELNRITGMSRSTIYRTIEKIDADGVVDRSIGSGRQPLCDVNDRRRLVGLALQHPYASSKVIGQMNIDRGGPPIAPRTVRNYLHDSGLIKITAKPTILLTDEHKRKRVEFADAHHTDDFSSTFITDEAGLSTDRHKCPLWSAGRRREIPTRNFPYHITIWGGISTMGPSTLGLVRGTIDQYKYMELLEEHLLPNAEAYYGQDWRFQQDNAPPHSARNTMQWLNDNVPQILPWPPNSPDLSPIENVWPLLKNDTEKKECKSVDELETNRQKLGKFGRGSDGSPSRQHTSPSQSLPRSEGRSGQIKFSLEFNSVRLFSNN